MVIFIDNRGHVLIFSRFAMSVEWSEVTSIQICWSFLVSPNYFKTKCGIRHT
jgi:hypothetical protein